MNKRLTIIPLCLLAIACTQYQPQPQPSVAASRQAQTLAYNNTTSPESIARQITVRVLVGDRRSSGTIIARRGNLYTILTNAHVTNKGNSYRITTPDGKTYPAKCAQPLKQGVCTADKNHDLALLEFTSSQTYTVPMWGDSRSLTPGETIYSAGFPFDGRDLKTSTGKVDIQTNKPLQGGYQIGFNVVTEPGMSGGSLLNSKGQLIGIIGFSSYPILNDGYQYQDGSQPAAVEIARWRKSSFAIPVATLATIDRQYTAMLPRNGSRNTTIASNNYTGIVKRVNDIAEQITVRIEQKDGENGSGVIVAHQGDTYYVVTAAHVVQKITQDSQTGRNVLREKLVKQIVTPTGAETIAISDSDIHVANPDLDIAVVKFRSTHRYQVAQIGQYEFDKKDWVFVSGFPGVDKSPARHRKLTVGQVQPRDEKELVVQNRGSDQQGQSVATLSRGYNLVYTNLSLHGMSGGAVLDRQGRLVGIDTGAENDPHGGAEINFGYALGIPISTILGVTSQSEPTWRLPIPDRQIAKNSVPEREQEDTAIQKIQIATIDKPNRTESQDTEKLLNYANLLWRSGQNQAAIDIFDRAIKLLRADPEIVGAKERLKIAYFGMGLAWFDIKDYRSAAVAFERVLAKDVAPEFTSGWRYLGLSRFLLKDYPGALTAYNTAIVQMQIDFVLYMERGVVFSESGAYQLSLNDHTKAISLQPNHSWSYFHRGNLKADKLNDRQGALADYNLTIKLNPKYVRAYINRGIMKANYLNDPQGALADYNLAIKLNPNSAIASAAYSNRGNLKADNLNDPQGALADYNLAIKFNPNYAGVYYNRGSLKADNLNDPQGALADYDYTIQLNPKYAAAYNNRGNLKVYDLNDPQGALADFNLAIKFSPNSAIASAAYNNRGFLKAGKLNDPQGALADYNFAIKFSPNDAGVYINRGALKADKLNDRSGAIDDIKQAARLYQQQGNTQNYQRAIDLLKKLQQSSRN
jgi:tetratricopeptide (TPR) repeat protein/S1-C subfamily serine protease